MNCRHLMRPRGTQFSPACLPQCLGRSSALTRSYLSSRMLPRPAFIVRFFSAVRSLSNLTEFIRVRRRYSQLSTHCSQ